MNCFYRQTQNPKIYPYPLVNVYKYCRNQVIIPLGNRDCWDKDDSLTFYFEGGIAEQLLDNEAHFMLYPTEDTSCLYLFKKTATQTLLYRKFPFYPSLPPAPNFEICVEKNGNVVYMRDTISISSGDVLIVKAEVDPEFRYNYPQDTMYSPQTIRICIQESEKQSA